MNVSPDASLHVADDAEMLARAAADWLRAEATHTEGIVRICLSGGSTPRRLYQLLAGPEIAARFPWSRVHWFWGDERFVPPDHPDSNYRMAREALLDHAPIPVANIHPMPTQGRTIEQAADAYADLLCTEYGADRLAPGRPLFDITLLGLGDDGHTASLLPGGAALDEAARWVVPVTVGRPEARLTLTYPPLNASRAVAFLVAGAGKRPALTRVWHGDRALPAARVRPVGDLHWFVDRAALPADA